MTPGETEVGERLIGDPADCDSEPIHIPGSIQPHGVLFTLQEPGLTVRQCSSNTMEMLGAPTDQVLGSPLERWLEEGCWNDLQSSIAPSSLEANPLYICKVQARISARSFYAIAHRYADVLFLELEETQGDRDISFQDLYPLVRSFMGQLKTSNTIVKLAQLAADEVRRITGFDRVLVYRFDETWSGQVLGESRDPARYSSFLDLRFPASDIPAQARQLYTSNRLRLIANADYKPVTIVSSGHAPDGGPIDLSFSVLRSVSPVHIEYLKNMGVLSSMSISIVVGESRLWGLIACHHHSKRLVPFDVRTACDLLGQSLSVQVESTEQRIEYEQRIRLKSSTSRLLSFMAQEDAFIDGLTRNPTELMEFVQASGAAVVFDDICSRFGDCPAEEDVRHIMRWLLDSGRQDVFSTDRLSTEMPGAERFRAEASGLLAISISKIHNSYVFWFRPEVIHTVTWAGQPDKMMEQQAKGAIRLHPRRSFEVWKETVEARSQPWLVAELEAADDLRNAIIGVVLRKAEELAELSSELQRSNKELEAFSYAVSHDLRAPFRHIIGYAELLRQSESASLGESGQRYLEVIIKSATFAGTLVDNLLHLSQVGRAKLNFIPVDMQQLAEDVRRDLDSEAGERAIAWKIHNLPEVEGDLVMLRLVLQNLLQNSIKYTRSRQLATIDITARNHEGEWIFCVSDNGIGFDQAYADKLFGVFQRLHKMEEYEGTGVGLANVRRIISRHGGRTWAEGRLGEGASFYFSLPERMQ